MKTNLFQFTTASDRGAATMPGTTLLQNITRGTLALVLAAFTFAAATARASDPIGIYALVDKVVLEPSEAAPERIQIWGAFAFAKRGYSDEYESPQRGFLYYKLRPEEKSTCLKEWADLKSVAGTNQVVGFAARHRDTGTLRKADVKPANPDPYPLGFGVTKLRDTDYAPVRALLKLAKAKDSNKDSSEPKSPAPPKRKDSSERKIFRAVARSGADPVRALTASGNN